MTEFTPDMAARMRELLARFKLPTVAAEVVRRLTEAGHDDAPTHAALRRKAWKDRRSPRQYIRDFDRLVETTSRARELYDQMLKLHPLRMNVNALWTSALAIKGQH
jgi:hypothetical protein